MLLQNTKRQLSHISAALFIELSYFPLEHLFSFTFTFRGEPHSLPEAWRLLPPSWRAWPPPATFHVLTLVIESESGGKTVVYAKTTLFETLVFNLESESRR